MYELINFLHKYYFGDNIEKSLIYKLLLLENRIIQKQKYIKLSRQNFCKREGKMFYFTIMNKYKKITC